MRTLAPFPSMDLNELLGLLGVMMGAGYNAKLRTEEKKADVADVH